MDAIEKILTEAGESYGRAEQAFSSAQDNSTSLQNNRAVLIENISKSEIVDGDAFADLILPKREVYIEHKLFSFLALNEENSNHKKVLSDMLELAFQKNREDNNTLYFNVRSKKNNANDSDYWTIMSVAYMHLWSVQTDAMRRADMEFQTDADLPTDLKLPSLDLPGVTVSTEPKYAPLDVILSGASILDLFLAARKVLRIFEQDLPAVLDKGVRLMARKENNQWQVHVLTGAQLQPISKKD